MMITEFEQETHDFDWYFTDGIHIAVVASGGGKLPPSVAKSSDNLRTLNGFMESLEFISNAFVYPEFLNQKSYNVSFFSEMARCGFFAYDKVTLGNFNDGAYQLIAKPLNPILLNSFPDNIKSMLLETVINNIPEAFVLSRFESLSF